MLPLRVCRPQKQGRDDARQYPRCSWIFPSFESPGECQRNGPIEGRLADATKDRMTKNGYRNSQADKPTGNRKPWQQGLRPNTAGDCACDGYWKRAKRQHSPG